MARPERVEPRIKLPKHLYLPEELTSKVTFLTIQINVLISYSTSLRKLLAPYLERISKNHVYGYVYGLTKGA
jgi:hypothetical protein